MITAIKRPEFINIPMDVAGTCLQGNINTSYRRLVETFGEPTLTDSEDGKTQVEWHIAFTDGVIATIYDWKQTTNPDSVREWHIGGHSMASVINVVDCIV